MNGYINIYRYSQVHIGYTGYSRTSDKAAQCKKIESRTRQADAKHARRTLARE